MPGFPTELRDSLILILLLVGLLQLYYLSCLLFPILGIYYPYGFIAHMAFYVAEFITLFLYIKIVNKASFVDLGFRRLEKWRTYCALGFVLAIFHNAIGLAFSIFVLGVRHGFYLPLYVHILVYFAAFLLISVSEEGVFRGYILGGLLKRYGESASIFFSSLLFGLYHLFYPYLLDWPFGTIMIINQVFLSFTAGLFLAYFYCKTGRNLFRPGELPFQSMFL
jgi:membrane protease YdiL (CAAX protease family)